jgi:tRNA pseudouridine32 synthase/23S rRNA pseudouridine746 synthase
MAKKMDEFHYNPPCLPFISTLYCDRYLAVFNKPSGLLSVPGRLEIHRDSLYTRVQRVLPTARIVHRLDMDTSGLVLMALTPEAHRDLNRQFAERRVEKRYTALVRGCVTASSGEVDLPLICDWPNRPLQKVDHEQGKAAQTRWQLVQRAEAYSRLHLIPVTGRSHQLRVHMQALGHPILGDRFYGGSTKEEGRLKLHAERLRFRHPQNGEDVVLEAPVPF